MKKVWEFHKLLRLQMAFKVLLFFSSTNLQNKWKKILISLGENTSCKVWRNHAQTFAVRTFKSRKTHGSLIQNWEIGRHYSTYIHHLDVVNP